MSINIGAWLIYARGEKCKRGERADRTGCIPSGRAGIQRARGRGEQWAVELESARDKAVRQRRSAARGAAQKPNRLISATQAAAARASREPAQQPKAKRKPRSSGEYRPSLPEVPSGDVAEYIRGWLGGRPQRGMRSWTVPAKHLDEAVMAIKHGVPWAWKPWAPKGPIPRSPQEQKIISQKEDETNLVPLKGNTYPLREYLKSIGGRFNPATKTWSVPKSKQEEAERAVRTGRPGRRGQYSADTRSSRAACHPGK